MIIVNKRKVMVFGVFDGLHPGHSYFLRKSKEFGDELYVVVARDENVERLKGRKPMHPFNKRMESLEDSGLADYVLEGDKEDGTWLILDKIHPDVVVLGYDQATLREKLLEYLSGKSFRFQLVDVGSFEPDKHKSSIYRIAKDNGSAV